MLFILQKRQGAGIVDRIAAETALVPYRKYLLFAIPQIQIFRTFTASFHCFPDALGGYHDRDRTIYEKFPFPAVARLQLPAVELDRKGKTHRKLRRHLPHKILRPVIHRINTIIHHKRDGNLPLAHQFQLFPCPDDKTVKSRRFQPGTMCFKIFLCPIAENMRHYQKTLLVCLMAARYPFVPLFDAKFSTIQIDGSDFRYG